MQPEIIVLVGIPGAGKSTLARTRFPGYKRINLDTLKSRHRENFAILEALERGESLVIDNTNTTRRSRSKYVHYARRFNFPIRAILLKCDLDVALRRNSTRSGKEYVPDRAVKMYYRILEPPSDDEGFDSIEIVETSKSPYTGGNTC